MANYYTIWSADLEVKTNEEKEWLEGILGLEIYRDDYPGVDEETETQRVMQEHGYQLQSEDFDFPFPGFDYEFEENKLWAFSEESGNVETLAKVIQAFFRKFRPDGFFSVTYAETCSNIRFGEFGGGAAVVTADKIEFTHTRSFVAQKWKNIRDNQPGHVAGWIMAIKHIKTF